MDRKNQYHIMLLSINKNIQYYKKMIDASNDPFQKMHYENLLFNAISQLDHWKNHYSEDDNRTNNQQDKRLTPQQREFTLEELAWHDGSGGRPAYVAVNGIVYDVSMESAWGGGTHFSLYAGKDLTSQFNGCHGGNLGTLKNLPKVGILKG